MKVIKKALLFEWDKGNNDKNWIKHEVKTEECEEVFYDSEAVVSHDSKNIVLPDTKHSQIEKRFYLLGKTKGDRKLTITYTFRIDKIRVISARSQNKKEQKEYENQKI